MSLNLKEDIRPISYVKANAADMMNYVNDSKHFRCSAFSK